MQFPKNDTISLFGAEDVNSRVVVWDVKRHYPKTSMRGEGRKTGTGTSEARTWPVKRAAFMHLRTLDTVRVAVGPRGSRP